MNKKITKLVALLLTMITLLTGCVLAQITSGSCEDVDKKEFEVLSEEDIDNGNLTIVRHKKTGKRFVIYTGYRKGGITPLD